MSRIKGRYVAKIILDLDAERTEDMASFEEIKKNFDGLTDTIKGELEQGDFSKVEVIQQYADLVEAEEEDE